MNEPKLYTSEEVFSETLKYFSDDELAASTNVSKYLLSKQEDGNRVYLESSPIDMHWRHANELARIDAKYPNPLTAQTFYDCLLHFRTICLGGSPMYGIGNKFVKISLSSCIAIDGPEDSISAIWETNKHMALLFKARCGVGYPLDTLRPEGMTVNNSAGTSTGAWSFAETGSETCRKIGQNGRRGALMTTMHVKHPDIEKFVTMKRDLTSCTGTNISVMISDDFMQAVKDDTDWTLQWPIDVPVELARYTKIVRARDIWHLINESAVMSAEPGVIFWDTYRNNLPANAYKEFESVCVNPCSEIALSPYDSCRLTSINLKWFVVNPFTDDASFDFKSFEAQVRLAMRIMDDIVDLEIESIQNIIDNIDDECEKTLWNRLKTAAERGRRTGLGTYALADCLARLGIKYDSREAQSMVNRIFECFRNSAYDESINLAIERGPFPVFDWETEKNNLFIQRLPNEIKERMAKYGRRNISLLTMAPTGSVSIVSQTSSGVEPVFMNIYVRRKKINPSDPVNQVDFVDEKGDKWTEFPVFHHNVKDYMEMFPDVSDQWENIKQTMKSDKWEEELKKILPSFFVTSHDIDPIRRVEIQGVIQQYIDHGISSTINCPKNTSIETVQSIYEKAHEHGLKGVTVYVDGSRAGVMNAIKKEIKNDEITDSTAPKRPKELICGIHRSQIDGQQWLIMVSLLGDRPYEIFGGLAEHVDIPRKYTTGKIIKRKCEKQNAKGRYNCYDLVLGDEDDPLTVKDIACTFNDGDYAATTRLISLNLRHGTPIQYIVEQLGRDDTSNFMSFSKVMARILKKYIVDGTQSGETCDMCGAKLRFEGGCFMCPDCAWTKCN